MILSPFGKTLINIPPMPIPIGNWEAFQAHENHLLQREMAYV
jgi:hypothetical protein